MCNAAFIVILLLASVIDWKYKTVPWYILAAIAAVGLLHHPDLSSVRGLLFGFVPLFLVGMFTGLGGGDIKYAAVCGFFMGDSILPAILIGLTTSLIIMPIVLKRQQKPIKGTGFPLVPFLSFGNIIMLLLH